MSAATAKIDGGTVPAGGVAPPSGKGRRKLVLLAVPVLLAGVLGGLWFTGVLPSLLGIGRTGAHGEARSGEVKEGGAKEGGARHAESKAGEGHGTPGKGGEAGGPSFVELPEIVANLNAGARKPVYVKLQVRLEMSRAGDEAAVKAVMPRLLDLFQTYLREMRPEELRGSAGSYRLREELTGRANIALAPIRVLNVLFTEMLIQ